MKTDEQRAALADLETEILEKQQARAAADLEARAGIVALQRERDRLIGDIKAADHLEKLSEPERAALAAALSDKG